MLEFFHTDEHRVKLLLFLAQNKACLRPSLSLSLHALPVLLLLLLLLFFLWSVSNQQFMAAVLTLIYALLRHKFNGNLSICSISHFGPLMSCEHLFSSIVPFKSSSYTRSNEEFELLCVIYASCYCVSFFFLLSKSRFNVLSSQKTLPCASLFQIMHF